MGTGEQWLDHWSSKLEKNRLRVFFRSGYVRCRGNR